MLGIRRTIERVRSGVLRLLADRRGDHQLERALSRIPFETNVPQTEFRIIVEGVARPFRSSIFQEVYRIAREGLQIAFRYSQASRIEAELHFASNYFEMVIRDNGRGVDALSLNDRCSERLGLQRMSQQAERIGARFRIMSRMDTGTEIQLSLPGGAAFKPEDTEDSTGCSQCLMPSRGTA